MFYGFFTFFYILFIFVAPFLTRPFINRDVAENLYWGWEWQLGYQKHPPLFAWINWSVVKLIGGSPDFTYLLSALQCLISLWLIYKTARLFTKDKKLAFLGALITILSIHFNHKMLTYNANTAQIPFWIASIYFYVRSLDTNKLKHWLLLGFFCGLCLLTKYYGLVLIASFFIITILIGRSKTVFLNPKVWAGICVLFLTIAPHIFWLIKHDFPSIKYGLQKSESLSHTRFELNFITQRLWFPFKFGIMQVILSLPVILGVGFAFGFKKFKFFTKKPGLLELLTYVPLGINLVGSLISGVTLSPNWGAPILSLLGVCLVLSNYYKPLNERLLKRYLLVFLSITILWLFSFTRLLQPGEPNMQELASFVENYAGGEVKYFVTYDRESQILASYMPHKPHVIVFFNFDKSLWINQDDFKANPFVVAFVKKCDYLNDNTLLNKVHKKRRCPEIGEDEVETKIRANYKDFERVAKKSGDREFVFYFVKPVKD